MTAFVLPLFFCLILVSVCSALDENVFIDDTFSASPVYNGCYRGTTCGSACLAHPNAPSAFEGDWHECPPGSSFSFSFNGTAVWVVGIRVDGWASNSTLWIDGRLAGTDLQSPQPTAQNYTYNRTIFFKNVTAAEHNLTVEIGANAVLLFDYAVYVTALANSSTSPSPAPVTTNAHTSLSDPLLVLPIVIPILVIFLLALCGIPSIRARYCRWRAERRPLAAEDREPQTREVGSTMPSLQRPPDAQIAALSSGESHAGAPETTHDEDEALARRLLQLELANPAARLRLERPRDTAVAGPSRAPVPDLSERSGASQLIPSRRIRHSGTTQYDEDEALARASQVFQIDLPESEVSTPVPVASSRARMPENAVAGLSRARSARTHARSGPPLRSTSELTQLDEDAALAQALFQIELADPSARVASMPTHAASTSASSRANTATGPSRISDVPIRRGGDEDEEGLREVPRV